jgi:hypothetical protein
VDTASSVNPGCKDFGGVVCSGMMENIGLCNLQIGLSLFVQEYAYNDSESYDIREDQVGWISIPRPYYIHSYPKLSLLSQSILVFSLIERIQSSRQFTALHNSNAAHVELKVVVYYAQYSASLSGRD